MAQDEYTVRYTLGAGDNWELTKYVIRSSPRYWLMHGALIFGSAYLAGTLRGTEAGTGAFDARLFLGVALFMAVLDYLAQRLKSIHRVRRTPGLVGAHELRITPEGLHGKSDGHPESHVTWSHIDRIVETETWLYLFINRVSAVIVPQSAFVSGADRAEFADAARRWRAGNSA